MKKSALRHQNNELILEHAVNFKSLFHSRIVKVSKERSYELSEDIEFYLVDMMSTFAETDNFFGNKNACCADETLASIYSQAILLPPSQKIVLLRRLGDIALYYSGFFPDRFRRKMIDVDYFIQMGETAYQSVADVMKNSPLSADFAKMFVNLSETFSQLVDLLSEVAEVDRKQNDVDILRLYERWLKTGSEYAKRKLLENNINLVPVNSLQFKS